MLQTRTTPRRFNPHHTGDWLEYVELMKYTQIIKGSFNPHHTGDWLEFSGANLANVDLYNVSILIILATGWNTLSF